MGLHRFAWPRSCIAARNRGIRSGPNAFGETDGGHLTVSSRHRTPERNRTRGTRGNTHLQMGTQALRVTAERKPVAAWSVRLEFVDLLPAWPLISTVVSFPSKGNNNCTLCYECRMSAFNRRDISFTRYGEVCCCYPQRAQVDIRFLCRACTASYDRPHSIYNPHFSSLLSSCHWKTPNFPPLLSPFHWYTGAVTYTRSTATAWNASPARVREIFHLQRLRGRSESGRSPAGGSVTDDNVPDRLRLVTTSSSLSTVFP